MKKLLLLIAFFSAITANVAHSQPRKGDWMVGANITGINGYVDPGISHSFNFHFAPTAGYFFGNRLAAGTSISLGYNQNSLLGHGWSYGMSPFLRYFFAPKEGMELKKAYVFTEVSVGYSGFMQKDKINSRKITGNLLNAGAGLGLTYFITNNVSVEGIFKVNYYSGTTRLITGLAQFQPSLGIGFQIYLQRRKKQAKTE